ncbi:MAG TPA: NAD-dependent epimerase/dehydratase family protein [Anaerolineae bacterium]|nr:NAD-dependent epimerase/dehydratase family protein [Anaerolineae bacterium]
MTRALVLGATGFIGGQIARAAVERGWQVRAARRRADFCGAIEAVAVEWVRADLEEAPTLLAAMREVDVVFHAAARYAHTTRHIERHVAAARAEVRRVLAAARQAGVSRLVYTSTLTTIGPALEPGQPADERSPYVPGSAQDAYHELKWIMEQDVLASGLPVVALCPTVVFGPGDIHLSISGPLLAIARGQVKFSLSGVVNVIDVRDVAGAHIAAAERGRIGERYILGGRNLAFAELIGCAARVAGVAPPRWRIPEPILDVVAGLSRGLPGDPASALRVRHLLQPLSHAKAAAELGLSPRPLEETLRDAFDWFRAYGYLKSRVV